MPANDNTPTSRELELQELLIAACLLNMETLIRYATEGR